MDHTAMMLILHTTDCYIIVNVEGHCRENMLITPPPLLNLILEACDDMAVGNWGALEVRIESPCITPPPTPSLPQWLATGSRQ